jgi:exosortase E/protease (VPEID-CTERM system)
LFAAGRRLDAVGLAALAAHGLSVTLLYWFGVYIFSPAGPPRGTPGVWLAIWVALALASVAFVVAAAGFRRHFIPLCRTAWPALLGGGLIGAGAWLAGQGSTLFWWPLGPWTLYAVEFLLKAVLADVVFVPAEALIGSPVFQVIVDPVCSGLEGLGLMTVFVSAYLLLARRQLRFPGALLLLPLGLAASLVANVARLAALVLVGTWISPEVASEGFHARAGWLFFSVLTLSLVVMARRLRFFAREQGTVGLRHPTAAYLLPFLTLLTVSLITGLGATTIDLWYGARIAAAIGVLLLFRGRYPNLALAKSWSWTAVASGVAAAAIFIALSPRPDASEIVALQDQWTSLPHWRRIGWLIARSFGSILIVPLVEELAFRGYLLRRLIAREFEAVPFRQMSLWAFVVSSMAFGAIHTAWLGGLLAGLIFAIVQIRSGTLAHAVLSHAASNAVVAFVVVAFDAWWLWV